MLEELAIRDFAIVDRLSIRFEAGLNLLTGETGAGKSILIGALGFILGAKADTGIIRSGAEETMVTGVIAVAGNEPALAWLSERGIAAEDGAIVVRRGLRRTGRGSAYVQDIPVTRQDLESLAAVLVEVHGQRDGPALLRKERQREILDRYAGLSKDVVEYASLYAELSARRRAYEAMRSSAADREREAEMLRFAVEEIASVAPRREEETELEDEERRLSQHERLYASAAQAAELLGEADGAVARLRKARVQLETAAGIDPRLSAESRRLDDAYYELEDLGEALSDYVSRLSFDPARLEQVEARMAALQRLKRKYGNDLSAVLDYATEAADRLSRLERWDEDRAGMERELAELEARAHATAERLSAARVEASKRLDAAVQVIVASLGMPNARFMTRISRLAPVDGKVVLGPHGLDEIVFYVSANKGEPPRPLADVASGGELSRLMLALKTVIAEDDGSPTLVFDEIDTGIGGEVALGVGGHLADLSLKRQVLCITHLASIAARADNHLMVDKRVEGDRTVTRVIRLEGDERVREVARMLSGDPSSRASLDHAAELVARLNRPRGA